MPRPRSQRILTIKENLRRSLQEGFRLPGARFLSTRALADKHGISYVTAHRMLRELADEGLVERRGASGTFLEGEVVSPTRAQLFFNPRARRPDSFGAHLLRVLTHELERLGIPFTCAWSGRPSPRVYPIVWERPDILQALAAQHRFALALNQPPPPGSAAFYIDSVAADDFSGGAWAAQWLRRLVGPTARLAVLTGPAHDLRSRERTAGFTSLEPAAVVVEGGTWFYDEALPQARRVLRSGAAGIFCCNDRLAQAVHDSAPAAAPPRIVGFDNAPIAGKVGLSTIGLPWRELVATTCEIVGRRLAGHRGPARRLTLPHEPVPRHTAA